MKLHLPVRLFRAVVALMTAGSCSAFAATATAIPSGYSKVIEVNSSSDFSVPSSTLSTAYVLNSSISITINAANKNLFFTSADENALKSITLQCASYTRALTGGQIEFNGLANLSLQNQSSLKNFSYSPIYTSGSGTRVAMMNIEKLSLIGNSCGDSDDSSYTDMHNNQWSRCGYYGGVIQNKGIYTASCIDVIRIDNNRAAGQSTAKILMYAYGGAIYNSNYMLFADNGQISISGNIASVETRHSNAVYGGAIYNSGGSITFRENEEVIISGNAAINTSGANDPHSGSDLGSYAEAGGIYSTGTISFRNNGSVIIYGNYSYSIDSKLYYLNGLTSSGTVEVSAALGNMVEFRDNIIIKSGTFNLNESFVDENGVHAQSGDIIFDASYVETYLRDIKNKANAGSVLDSEIKYAKTSKIKTTTKLFDGNLIIRGGAIYECYDILLYNSAYSSSTLYLDGGNINSTGKVVAYSGSTLKLSSINAAEMRELEMKDGSIWAFDVSAEHSSAAALTLGGNLIFDGKLTVNISVDESLSQGQYTLLDLTSSSAPTINWTSENVTVTGMNGYVVSFDDLKWVDNTLYLNYSGIPETGESGGNDGGNSSIPELLVATWTNKVGDGMWDGTSKNWSQNEVDYAYLDGVQVVFGNGGSGMVTLVGDIEPASILVDSTADYTWNADSTAGGKLTGSMELTKKGSGTLTINTANDYTGGTAILGGTVVAGTPAALGSGAVRISDASLIIQADGFSNALSTAGNCNIEVQENGSLILTERILNTGNLTINGSINASALQLIGTDDTYVDVRGHEGSSGFMKASGFYVQVVSGGTVSGNAEVTHGTNTLTLGSDGYATCGGGITYDAYYLNDGDSVSVVDAERASSDVLTTVNMKGGTLYADASTAVSATGGNILLSAGTLSGTAKDTDVTATGGTLSAVLSGSGYLSAKGNVTISASNTHTGGTMFNGGTFTLTHANALGNGTVMTSGTNTLLGNANQSLKSTILNSGALTLSGSWNLSALDLSTQAATHVDINGHTGESGFFKSTLYEVRMVQGGTTTATDLSLTHNKLADGLQLVLGSNGTATAGGVVNYNTYYLAGRDSVSVSEADTAAGGLLNNVVMNGGNLTVDASTHVTATGGSITVTDDATLSGTITDTDMTFAPGDYTADITADINGNGSLTINGGNVSLSGDNSYTGGTIINGGSLIAKDADALGTGTVTVNGGTLNLNNQQVGNDITLNNGTLVGNDKYNGNLSIGGDNVAVEGGYTLGAGKVLEVEVGGTEFNSDLTLGGGTLLFKGAPLTVNGEVSFVDGTTTLVDLRSWEGQLTDGLTLAVLGSDVAGWTDACLELIGMSDMSLLFDSVTGTLTLQVESEQPVIEVPTITWLGAKNTVWQHGKAGWMNATTGYDAVYENGAEVIFTQSGTVTIAGAVAPGSIIVAGDKAIAFKSDKANPGRIVGETSLIKRGNGQLTLNDGNSYTGGTFIEAGTVTAGGAASFGSGAITISGGTLDLKGKAVLNDITLTGGGHHQERQNIRR